jgi:hypothetical protein
MSAARLAYLVFAIRVVCSLRPSWLRMTVTTAFAFAVSLALKALSKQTR